MAEAQFRNLHVDALNSEQKNLIHSCNTQLHTIAPRNKTS